nr:MAG TPA: tail protein [Caudoviricetes sp.]
MGKLLVFQIGLLNSNTWESFNPDFGSPVVVVSAKIDNPVVKTDTVDVNTNDGTLDFSEAQGLHYGNRNIEVILRKISGSTYDFDAFRRKYLGQMVKCMFEEITETTGQYYYYGRLVDITDDYKADFRTITLTIDAQPFRRSKNNPTVANVAINAAGSLMPATSSATIETVASLGTMQYSYVDDMYLGKDVVIYLPGSLALPRNGTLYLTATGLAASKKYKLLFAAPTNDGNITIRNASKTGTILVAGTKDVVEFTAASSTIVLCFNVVYGNTQFNNISLLLADFTSSHLANGDKIQTPTYEALTQDVFVNVNGKQAKLSAGSTSNPYFTIPRGGCDILATGESAGYLKLTYEQEVL